MKADQFKSSKRQRIKRKDLNITSLIDILTILLVFLLKNVSMDAAKNKPPKSMLLPPTATNEQLIEDGRTVVIKVYPDQILYGMDAVYVGSLDDLMNNPSTRKALEGHLLLDKESIIDNDNDAVPCILLQVDKSVKCSYVTELFKVSGKAGYVNIYFSTLYESNLTDKYRGSTS